jgi:hypothetical protein
MIHSLQLVVKTPCYGVREKRSLLYGPLRRPPKTKKISSPSKFKISFFNKVFILFADL